MLRFRFKACVKCGGDLALDDGDWICLQCGTYYYVNLYPAASALGPTPSQDRNRLEKNKGFLFPPRMEAVTLFPNGLETIVTEQDLARK